MSDIRTAAVIGAGVIGAGWAARFVLNGIDVIVHDPHPEAERRTRDVLANAERSHARLTMAPSGRQGTLRFAPSIAEAVAQADFVQESAPEREDVKKALLAEIDARARPDVLVCSSTSGLLPNRLQMDMKYPDRFLVGHPFNPVYLLPLVELCGGKRTAADAITRAREFYNGIGMRPLVVRKEIDGFIADRLLEALWREALWLVHDDIATVEEIDDAIRFGAGLRWAFMGTFQLYRLAGGEDGMRHFMAQFGPALQLPWSKLTDVPELTDAFIDKIARQSDAQAGGAPLRDAERKRDDCLVAIMQALKAQDYAAGAVLAGYEEKLFAAAHEDAGAERETDPTQPLQLHTGRVLPEWVDYNNHMTESRYLQIFGDSSDALFHSIGIDGDYHASGFSYYTVETHIVHRREIAGLEPFYTTTQILDADPKRLHVFHRLHHGRSHDLLASAEQMLLHVDTRQSRACPARADIHERVIALRDAHVHLERPEQAGRHVGVMTAPEIAAP
ncbi:carnitine 3-dehydrogenase [Acidiphilium iwatense]|uniref:L-carnitine dehydrogenase n=1 Tax=Acidiphilium iwatense TaxID=768198 RepID=A0ABS9DR79_9PROT|nr:carnitine 3-dehydrogenase [Acidiphilium iwatense]MCF3945159.1 carnitine 3-dehydrogenase [Acidiphilium iwatense]